MTTCSTNGARKIYFHTSSSLALHVNFKASTDLSLRTGALKRLDEKIDLKKKSSRYEKRQDLFEKGL